MVERSLTRISVRPAARTFYIGNSLCSLRNWYLNLIGLPPDRIYINAEFQGLRIVIHGRQYWFVVYYLALGYGQRGTNMTMKIWTDNRFLSPRLERKLLLLPSSLQRQQQNIYVGAC